MQQQFVKPINQLIVQPNKEQSTNQQANQSRKQSVNQQIDQTSKQPPNRSTN